jgi:hypothetical protein
MVLESTPEKLVLDSRGWMTHTVSTFDKNEDVARIVRHVLFWRRPRELRLGEIDDVRVTEVPDPASGAKTHFPVLHASSGTVVALSGSDEENADEIAEKVRSFLKLAH